VSSAYPELKLGGTVSFIDPQVSAETRTVKVRIQVENPHQELRLGLLAEVQVEATDRPTATLAPKMAIQNVADRSFVYMPSPDAPTQFTEREVRVGAPSGEHVQILSGLRPGDKVVTEGSFFLRAERERLGLRPSGSRTPVTRRLDTTVPSKSSLQPTKVLVTKRGYEPAKLNLRAGLPARVTFMRTTDQTCGTEVIFPGIGVKRELPLNRPVEIEFPPPKSGELPFVCGMNMLKGVVIAQ
jgi:hypothetical protein